VLTDIPPPQLAAVVSAIVAPDSVSARPGKELVSYPPSDAVAHAVEALEDARLALFALQIKAGVDMPIAIDLRLAGLVEAWASGASWSQLMGDCVLDDGDVARLLLRTVDVLKQVSYCEWLLPAVRQSSKKALRAMDRQPISDLVN
jgi:superfamily II RNA helicase